MCVVFVAPPAAVIADTFPLLLVIPVEDIVNVVPGVTAIARVDGAFAGLSDHPALLPAGIPESQMSEVPGTVVITVVFNGKTAIAVADTSHVVRTTPVPLISGNVSGTAFPFAAVRDTVTCTAI
jgi:hypothetical protein